MRALCAGWLWTIALLAPGTALALPPPDPWTEENLSFRLLLGNLDGSENTRLLHDDSHRYTVGFDFSSPVAWDGRLEAVMEIWTDERGYSGATTAAGERTGTLTLGALALTYGVRARTLTDLRPYGLVAAGFQGNRLEGRTRADPSVTVKEENLVPAAQVGLGIEWEVGNDLVSLDWRHWFARGDFTEFDAHGLDLGGNYLGIGLGHRW